MPQIIIQRGGNFFAVETEQNVDPGGLNVCVNDADALALAGKDGGEIGRGIGLARAAAEGVDGNNLGNRLCSGVG
jgi:hypothetical protein